MVRFVVAWAILASVFLVSAEFELQAKEKSEERSEFCARPKVAAEREICRDRDLTRKDATLNEVYRNLRRKLKRAEFVELRNEQRAWLRERNRCGEDTACLATKYEDRVAVLEQMLESLEHPNKSHVEIGCEGEGLRFVDGECIKIGGAENRSAALDKKLILSAKNKTCGSYQNNKSQDSDMPVTVTFVNRTDSHRSVMWINFEGMPVSYAELDPGQTYTINTFVTHPWMFTDGPGNCIEMFMPERGVSRYEITASSPFSGPEYD